VVGVKVHEVPASIVAVPFRNQTYEYEIVAPVKVELKKTGSPTSVDAATGVIETVTRVAPDAALIASANTNKQAITTTKNRARTDFEDP